MSGRGGRRGDEGWVTLFHGSGRSAAGSAGEPPGAEAAGCPPSPKQERVGWHFAYDATCCTPQIERKSRQKLCANFTRWTWGGSGVWGGKLRKLHFAGGG